MHRDPLTGRAPRLSLASSFLADISNVVVSGKAAFVAELRQADLRSANHPRAAFGLDRRGALRRERGGKETSRIAVEACRFIA